MKDCQLQNKETKETKLFQSTQNNLGTEFKKGLNQAIKNKGTLGTY
jgi:hypothetical protein